MSKQLDRSNPIPDTTVFDGRMSRRGYRLNKLCGSLITPETRAAFEADEQVYMTRFGLAEEEKALQMWKSRSLRDFCATFSCTSLHFPAKVAQRALHKVVIRREN